MEMLSRFVSSAVQARELCRRSSRLCKLTWNVSLSQTVWTPLSYNYQSALTQNEMTAGVHCAHFTMQHGVGCNARVGVVGPGFDPTNDCCAWKSSEGWLMHTASGMLCRDGRGTDWAGQEELKQGDVIGLVLDLDAGR